MRRSKSIGPSHGGGQECRFYTLNALYYRSTELKSLKGDLSQIALEAFWSHNKDIPDSARSKVINTETFLRFLKMKYPKYYQ